METNHISFVYDDFVTARDGLHNLKCVMVLKCPLICF